LVASIAIAAATGSIAGALAALGLVQPVPHTAEAAPAATIYETRALQGSITQLRTELAALRTSADVASRSASGQLARIGERVDRIERVQAAPAREATASISPLQAQQPLQPAVAAMPAQQPRSRNISGWSVRDVYLGMALIESRQGGTMEVMPGDMIRGIGRIEAIRKQDGRWVVVTSRGIIGSAR
jgi:hypothetical protein